MGQCCGVDVKQKIAEQTDPAAKPLKEIERNKDPYSNDPKYFVRQLVALLTHESHNEPDETMEALLLCHRCFSTSMDLFDAIKEKFFLSYPVYCAITYEKLQITDSDRVLFQVPSDPSKTSKTSKTADSTQAGAVATTAPTSATSTKNAGSANTARTTPATPATQTSASSTTPHVSKAVSVASQSNASSQQDLTQSNNSNNSNNSNPSNRKNSPLRVASMTSDSKQVPPLTIPPIKANLPHTSHNPNDPNDLNNGDIPPHPNMLSKEEWIQKVKIPIQQRCMKLLMRWIELYWSVDFANNHNNDNENGQADADKNKNNDSNNKHAGGAGGKDAKNPHVVGSESPATPPGPRDSQQLAIPLALVVAPGPEDKNKNSPNESKDAKDANAGKTSNKAVVVRPQLVGDHSVETQSHVAENSHGGGGGAGKSPLHAPSLGTVPEEGGNSPSKGSNGVSKDLGDFGAKMTIQNDSELILALHQFVKEMKQLREDYSNENHLNPHAPNVGSRSYYDYIHQIYDVDDIKEEIAQIRTKMKAKQTRLKARVKKKASQAKLLLKRHSRSRTNDPDDDLKQFQKQNSVDTSRDNSQKPQLSGRTLSLQSHDRMASAGSAHASDDEKDAKESKGTKEIKEAKDLIVKDVKESKEAKDATQEIEIISEDAIDGAYFLDPGAASDAKSNVSSPNRSRSPSEPLPDAQSEENVILDAQAESGHDSGEKSVHYPSFLQRYIFEVQNIIAQQQLWFVEIMEKASALENEKRLLRRKKREAKKQRMKLRRMRNPRASLNIIDCDDEDSHDVSHMSHNNSHMKPRHVPTGSGVISQDAAGYKFEADYTDESESELSSSSGSDVGINHTSWMDSNANTFRTRLKSDVSNSNAPGSNANVQHNHQNVGSNGNNETRGKKISVSEDKDFTLTMPVTRERDNALSVSYSARDWKYAAAHANDAANQTESLYFLKVKNRETARRYARQLTLKDYDVFQTIHIRQFLIKILEKSRKDEYSDLTLLIDRFQQCHQYVVVSIIGASSLGHRVEMIDFFIHVAEFLLKLNNLYSFMAVCTGLDSISVQKCSIAWDFVNTSNRRKFEKILRPLCSGSKNFGKLRAHAKKMKAPGIPFLGIILKDLTYMNDGAVSKLKKEFDGQINFVKYLRFYGICHDNIMTLQSGNYFDNSDNTFNLSVDKNLQREITRDMNLYLLLNKQTIRMFTAEAQRMDATEVESYKKHLNKELDRTLNSSPAFGYSYGTRNSVSRTKNDLIGHAAHGTESDMSDDMNDKRKSYKDNKRKGDTAGSSGKIGIFGFKLGSSSKKKKERAHTDDIGTLDTLRES